MSVLKVMVVDDHAVVRQGIRAVVEGAEGVEVVADAGSGPEAIGLVAKTSPDVVVLDVNMPEMDGLEVTRRLRAGGNDCRILILSMHDNPEYVLEALRAGADGYVLKDADPSELREAVRVVAAGKEYLSERVTHQLSVALRAELERDKQRGRLERLTPREREVMFRVAEGKTSREIGDDLGISHRTVETHRERVMAKLRMKSVADLTRFVVEMGLEDEGAA
jgi:DNA-binding NarL/FixJ family response regulator